MKQQSEKGGRVVTWQVGEVGGSWFCSRVGDAR